MINQMDLLFAFKQYTTLTSFGQLNQSSLNYPCHHHDQNQNLHNSIYKVLVLHPCPPLPETIYWIKSNKKRKTEEQQYVQLVRVTTSSGTSMTDGVVWKGALGAWGSLESCSSNVFLENQLKQSILIKFSFKKILAIILDVWVTNN